MEEEEHNHAAFKAIYYTLKIIPCAINFIEETANEQFFKGHDELEWNEIRFIEPNNVSNEWTCFS